MHESIFLLVNIWFKKCLIWLPSQRHWKKKKFYLLTLSAIEVGDGQQKNYSEDVDGPHSGNNISEGAEEEDFAVKVQRRKILLQLGRGRILMPFPPVAGLYIGIFPAIFPPALPSGFLSFFPPAHPCSISFFPAILPNQSPVQKNQLPVYRTIAAAIANPIFPKEGELLQESCMSHKRIGNFRHLF